MTIKEPKGRLSKPTPLPKTKPLPDDNHDLLREHWLELYETMARKGVSYLNLSDEIEPIMEWVGTNKEKLKLVKIVALRETSSHRIVSGAEKLLRDLDVTLNPSQTRSDADAAD